MTTSSRNPKVDAVLRHAKKWREELSKLREIILECGLVEELKWYQPCYTLDGKNIVLIHGFKEYCALLFMKGALLKDPKGILIQQTVNVQSGRQIRFTNTGQILAQEPILKAYIREAIEVEKAGLQVKMNKKLTLPAEFKKKLAANPALKKAFQSLTPGRQRGYGFYFSSAKQSKTREARIEKHVKQILAGKGLDD